MDNLYDKIIGKLKEIFDGESSGHDISHLARVYNIARHLQEKEGGNREVILLSALLHDIHRLIERESNSFCSPKDSLAQVRSTLGEIGIEEQIIIKVLHCIEFHEEYSFSDEGKTVKDLETLILQDADNLDALGAIGIARTFSFGTAHKIPIWIPEMPFERERFDEQVTDPSTIHHFYSKLLRLKNNMNTKTGREMAEERDAFTRQFLELFFKEWSGEI